MKITVDDVVREVRKLALEQPDFNYKQQIKIPGTLDPVIGGCSYLAGMTESSFKYYQRHGMFPEGLTYEEARQRGLIGQRCIVGQALSILGVSDAILKTMEGVEADYLVGQLTQRDQKVPKAAARLWLSFVQGSQDDGVPWAESVANANEVYPNV